jgi:predicted nuclease of predicted toxin-antitoxin system
VRFLIDNNLSPALAEILRAAGHDVSHLREIGLQTATDEVVLARARAEQRVLVSADTDFGALLARSRAEFPSVLLMRRLVGRRAAEQAATILANRFADLNAHRGGDREAGAGAAVHPGGLNSFQRPSEMTSTPPPVTLMAV